MGIFVSMNQEIITLEEVKETIPAIEIEVKQCRKKECLQFKPITEFYKCSASKDGHHSYCNDCQRIIGIERNEERKKRNKQLAFIRDEKTKKTNQYYINEAKKIYGTDESQLKQCHQITCERFKPLSEFGKSMSYPDGYSPICKECILKGALKDAIQKEHTKRAKENYIHPEDIIFRPIPIDDFLELIIIRPHLPISEYFMGSKTKNNYVLPDDIEFMADEYCHGEPPSSFKDFAREVKPIRYVMVWDEDGNYISEELLQEETVNDITTILENWKELSEVA